MLFNSGEFLLFFPIVVLFYYVLPIKIRNFWLLLASYYFYMCWNAKYAILLLSSTIVTYLGGILIEIIKNSNFEHKLVLNRFTLAIVVSINLFILFYYKYISFILGVAQKVASLINIEFNVPIFDIVLPVGISFYIFQALGYLIDVYRNDIYAEKNFLNYALFVSFFPQLVAGPIERSKNLLSQLSVYQILDLQNARNGLLTMLWGYFLKLVIADRSAIIVNTVYGAYKDYSGFQLVIANAMFAIQIYCDFMGYSTIARGAAKVLGFDLMENFKQPYFAMSIKDFWRRWHISLSTWFRDYLYIPLGGSRCSKYKKYINLMITFMISGLWHGANVTFVAWGFIHGIYQVVEDLVNPIVVRIIKLININTEVFSWKLLRIIKTFILTDIAWTFFRADTLTTAFYILTKSFDFSNVALILNEGIYQFGLDVMNVNILLIALGVLLVSSYMKEKGINVYEWLSLQNTVFRYAIYWSAISLIILSLDIMGQEFLYFQF